MVELHRRRCSPTCHLLVTVVVVHLLFCSPTVRAQVLENPVATVPTSVSRWLIRPPMRNFTFTDGSQVRPILLRQTRAGLGVSYACGFYCRGDCTSFIFAVYIIHSNSAGEIVLPASGFPQVVWAANRAYPVTENATLELTSDGDLVLTDADWTKVWSSGTSGKLVTGMNMTESGNLVLFGGLNNHTIWDSFSSPTDSLVPGQKLQVDQALTANDSAGNSTEGLYSLFANSTGLIAFLRSNPPERYAAFSLNPPEGRVSVRSNPLERYISYTPPSGAEGGFFEFRNGSHFTNTSDQHLPPSQFLRLEADGSLRVYEWSSGGWVAGSDLLNDGGSLCFHPTVCGRYGICSGSNQCECPQGDAGRDNYFQPIDDRNLGSGCREVTPLACEDSYKHRMQRLNDVSYFTYDQQPPDISETDEGGCESACLRNCSCRAAFFRHGTNYSAGSCFLTSEVFSMKNNRPEVTHYNSTAFIKVQNPEKVPRVAIIVPSVALGLRLLLVISFCVFVLRKTAAALKREEERMVREDEEVGDDLQNISGMPRKFSLKELTAVTNGFSQKLGRGGFGSVYAGAVDGNPVAVKHLDGAGQGRKEFLAEVQTIGRIHHFNLVKLVGYCAERSSRLLVYEFMPNSSLDRWIFHDAQRRAALGWETRRKIVLGIARALAYLHEECAQKIAHLDIKPQNILLDESFEAKVSDFGMAKLIDRDKTHVETLMRGTIGYLAPEWLSSMITEMADVYSFGVVILEVVSGRKNLDRSLPEGDALLVEVTRKKAQNGDLRDLIDRSIGITGEGQAGEATRMVQLAMWCLQHDPRRRPSMPTVVKVLEGIVSVETDLEDGSWGSAAVDFSGIETSGSAPLLGSVLSGPR